MVSPGTLADTPTQREFTRSLEALDVREGRGIVGRSQNLNGVWRAFSVPISGMISDQAALPGLIAGTGGTWTSRADALNRLGIKVGTAQTNLAGDTFVSRAVQWDVANGITDLNALLPANSGWVRQNATMISDSGFIIGTGTKSGRSLRLAFTLIELLRVIRDPGGVAVADADGPCIRRAQLSCP